MGKIHRVDIINGRECSIFVHFHYTSWPILMAVWCEKDNRFDPTQTTQWLWSPSDILRQASSFVIINYNSQTKFVVMGGRGGQMLFKFCKRNKNYFIHLRSQCDHNEGKLSLQSRAPFTSHHIKHRRVRQTCQADMSGHQHYVRQHRTNSTLWIGLLIPFVLPLRNICQYFANDDKNPIRLLLSQVSPSLGQLLCFFLLNLDRISVGFLLKTSPGYSWRLQHVPTTGHLHKYASYFMLELQDHKGFNISLRKPFHLEGSLPINILFTCQGLHSSLWKQTPSFIVNRL